MPCLIFDFDGTLADTRTGILATAQEVLRRMGLPPADEAALGATIGLPLRENFTRGAGLSEEEADRAVAIYREIFESVGVPAIVLFPGVSETLKELAARGIPMAGARFGICHPRQDGRPARRDARDRRHHLRHRNGQGGGLPHLRRDLWKPKRRPTGRRFSRLLAGRSPQAGQPLKPMGFRVDLRPRDDGLHRMASSR